MIRKRITNRVISKIVFAGLLVSTLPASFPIKGQAQSREALRTEIALEIKNIEKTVKKLKRAKIIIPTVMAGAGLALTVAAAAGVAALFLVPRLKIFENIKKIKFSKKSIDEMRNSTHLLSKVNLLDGLESLLDDVYKGALSDKSYRKISALIQNLSLNESRINISNFFKEVSNIQVYAAIYLDPKLITSEYIKKKATNPDKVADATKFLTTTLEPIAKDISDILQKEIHNLRKQRNLLLIGTGASLAAITISLSGLVGTAAISIGTLFGLSAISVAKAFKGAKKLEEFDKKYSGILTPKQKQVIAQLKKLSKNVITQAIIKNLRLKATLKNASNLAMKQSPLLVAALGGQKKARKIFSKYIKGMWQKELFEKVLSEGVGFIKRPLVKLQLKLTKIKLKKQEKKHPQLKTALNKAVQLYTAQASEILQGLQKDLIKAAVKKELPEMKLQPVIPL